MEENFYNYQDCGEYYPILNQLATDEKDEVENSQFLCEFCGRKCEGNFSYKRHLELHIRKTAKYCETPSRNCELCGKRFKSKSGWMYHVKTRACEKKDFVCTLCPNIFNTRQELFSHIRSHTTDGKQFKCETCEKIFSSKFSLRSHSRMHTSRNKPFKCNKCPKSYTNNNQLLHHFEVHDTVACSYCTKLFRSQSGLREHLKSRSVSECGKCKKSFCNIRDLFIHKCSKEKITTRKSQINETVSEVERVTNQTETNTYHGNIETKEAIADLETTFLNFDELEFCNADMQTIEHSDVALDEMSNTPIRVSSDETSIGFAEVRTEESSNELFFQTFHLVKYALESL